MLDNYVKRIYRYKVDFFISCLKRHFTNFIELQQAFKLIKVLSP